MNKNYGFSFQNKNADLINSKMKTKIYNKVSQEILNGKIKPGETIIIKDLTNKYNVSTTPIREALTILENEGVLIKEPYKSYQVKEFSLKEIEKIYEARIAIETQVVRLAARRINKQLENKFINILEKSKTTIEKNKFKQFNKYNSNFHFTIFEAGNNKYLFEMMNNINKQIILLNYQASYYLEELKEERLKRAYKEHKLVFEKIRDKNEEKAAKLLEEHLLSSLQRFCND